MTDSQDQQLDDRLRAYGQRWRDLNPVDREPGDFLGDRLAVSPLEDIGGPVPIGSRRRRLRTWAVAAAAVVLLAGIGSLLAVILHSTKKPVAALAAPTCLASGPDVRDPLSIPPARIQTTARLVPKQTPGAAVICTYTYHDVSEPGPLQVVALEGSLSAMAAQLYRTPLQLSNPAQCSAVLPENTTLRLLGLAYPGGTLWIATSDQCGAETQNGTDTFVDIFATLTRAAKLGTWPTK